jgi:hypothetical protein
MEEVVGFLGFSLGVAVAGSLVRSFSGGLRPVAKSVIRAGIVATDAVTATATRAGSAVAGMAAEARDEGAGAATDRDATPRQIIIARE